MNLEQLEKLNELKEKGILTEEEFQQQKEKILAGSGTFNIADDNRTYAMFMHLAQLFCIILPVLGWVVPLVMWLLNKDKDDYINQQGKVVFNWIISVLIYAVAGWLLVLILIGIPILLALLVCSIIFTIMGALNAKEGIIKNYPLAIRFFKVEETPAA